MKNDSILRSFERSLYQATDKDALSSLDHWIIFFVKTVNFILAIYAFAQLLLTFFAGFDLSALNAITLGFAVFGLFASGMFDMYHRMIRAKHDVYAKLKLYIFGVYELLYGIPMALLVSIAIGFREVVTQIELVFNVMFIIWAVVLALFGYALDGFIKSRTHDVIFSLLHDRLKAFSVAISELIGYRISRYRNFALVLSLATAYSLLFMSAALLTEFNEPDLVRMQDTAVRVMTQSNLEVAQAMNKVGAHAATDITGFGLLGHASNVAIMSGVDVVIDTMPVIPGTLNLATFFGHRLSEGMGAETAGGMLVFLQPDVVDDFHGILRNAGLPSWTVGKALKPKGAPKAWLAKGVQFIETEFL